MSDGLPQPRRRLAVLAIALASMMGTLDVNIANTALPTIARDLGVTPATSIWIVNAYQIASVATLFTFAALGQLYGPARIYRLGVLVFIAASLVCTFSHTFGLLILGRVLQGFGASAVFAITPALYREVFPRAQLGRALGINATIVATSTAAGPALGGFILAVASWPWIYAINIPFGIANVALNRALPHDDRNDGRLDVPSALSSALRVKARAASPRRRSRSARSRSDGSCAGKRRWNGRCLPSACSAYQRSRLRDSRVLPALLRRHSPM